MLSNIHKTDILECISHLSSDEVFTPPKLVNQMLDELPKSIWSDPYTTFLDPVCKSGVFLREITKRLDHGLKSEIPDTKNRIDHILKEQVFGIGTSELTALISRRTLYCSKVANGEYSIIRFKDLQGNIKYVETKHSWKDGKCEYCGVSKVIYDRDSSSESYAFSFIHAKNPENFFDMKFDVIIGNPPYQMNDGGGTGSSAIPIYHKFIEQAITLNPKYISFITPSRWFTGGRKSLDRFRKKMLNDKRIKVIHDFIDASNCFTDVEIKGGGKLFFMG